MQLREKYRWHLAIVFLMIALVIINFVFIYIILDKNTGSKYASQDTKTIKSDENKVLYKSASQIIKENAIYAFFIFCILVFAFLIYQKWQTK